MNEMERLMSFFLITGRMERQIQKLKTLYMEEFSLKGSELPVLFALCKDEEGLRMDQLCEEVGADKSQISRSLKNLKNAGMVCKENESGYKGRYSLSQAGQAAAEKLADSAQEIFRKAHLQISSKQWENYYDFMNRIIQYMDEEITSKESMRSA